MLKKITQDLFDTNPIYQKTPVKASDVIQPLGYWAIQSLDIKHEPKRKIVKKNRQVFEFPQNIFPKIMFNKKNLQNQDDFTVKTAGRKNQLVGGENYTEFKGKQQNIIENRKLVKWFNNSQQQLLKFIELLQYLKLDHLLTIHDFALSQYFYFCQSNNLYFRDYIQSLLNKQIIQYKVTPTYALSSICNDSSQIKKVNIQNLDELIQYTNQLKEKNLKLDPFFSGYQIFFGLQDLTQSLEQKSDMQQSKFLKYLQYYIFMITSLLADGQLAVIKLYSSIYQKTNEYIFLLRWMFVKLTIVKPMLSNHLDHQKFIICQGYKKSAGEKIRNLLSTNFNISQNTLLVKPQIIDKTQYKNIMTDFNNKILHNEFRKLNDMFNDNQNLLYLPHEEFLTNKLKSAYSLNDYVNKSLQRIYSQKRIIKNQQTKIDEEKKKMQQQKPVQNQNVVQKVSLLATIRPRKK